MRSLKSMLSYQDEEQMRQLLWYQWKRCYHNRMRCYETTGTRSIKRMLWETEENVMKPTTGPVAAKPTYAEKLKDCLKPIVLLTVPIVNTVATNLNTRQLRYKVLSGLCNAVSSVQYVGMMSGVRASHTSGWRRDTTCATTFSKRQPLPQPQPHPQLHLPTSNLAGNSVTVQPTYV